MSLFASPEVHAVPGTPQGSVLGPLLFLLSRNGFIQCQLVANSKRILYADDIVLYKPIKTVSDYIHIQKDHALIQKMSEDSRLVFNPKKLKFMILTRNKNLLKRPEVLLGTYPIERLISILLSLLVA